MATLTVVEHYFNPHLTTGLDDGTSEANAWQTFTSLNTGMVTAMAAAVANEQIRVNVKSNTSFSTARYDEADTSGTAQNPIWYRGYTTTPGDNGLAYFDRTGTPGAGGTGSMFKSSYLILEGLVQDVSPIGGYTDGLVVGADCKAYRCKFITPSTYSVARVNYAVDCYFQCNRIGGLNSDNTVLERNMFILSTSSGNHPIYIDPYSAFNSIQDNCIYVSNVSGVNACIYWNRPKDGSGAQVHNNRVVCAGITGVSPAFLGMPSVDTVLERGMFASGNIAWNTSKFLEWTTNPPTNESYAQSTTMFNNNWLDSSFTSWADYANLGEIGYRQQNLTISADPFVDAANGDFNLDPNGANFTDLINAGIPERIGFNWDTLLPESTASTSAGVGDPAGGALGRVF